MISCPIASLPSRLVYLKIHVGGRRLALDHDIIEKNIVPSVELGNDFTSVSSFPQN